jgi:hypothetical protein
MTQGGCTWLTCARQSGFGKSFASLREMKPRSAAAWSKMDLIVAKWFVYVLLGLAVAYLWVHFNAPQYDPFRSLE